MAVTLALALTLAVETVASPTPPVVPAQWSAKCIETLSPTVKLPCYFTYDRPGQKTGTQTHFEFPMAPAQWAGTEKAMLVQAQLKLGNDTYAVNNGNSYLTYAGKEFADPFAFVAHSTFVTTTKVNGVECNAFKMVYQTTTLMYYATVDDNIPARSYSETNVTLPGQPTKAVVRDLVFTEFTVNTNSSMFDTLNTTAAVHPALCSDPAKAPAPVTLDMYIFHPRGIHDIADQDTADIIGDTAFVCADAGNTKGDEFSVVTWYKVEVLPVWGQYKLCNGNPGVCIGAEDFYVGRQAAFALGSPLAGQCSDQDLELTGTWYDLPRGGQCNGTQTPAPGVCSWRVVQAVKTIDALGCLFVEQGMLASCHREMRLPLPQTAAIFKAAFSSENKTAGGCPAI